MRALRRCLAISGAAYAAAVALLWLFQRELIYLPDDAPYVPPSHYAMLEGVEEVSLETSDGIGLTAWYAPAPAHRPTVVMFTGNGSSLRSSRYRVRHFMEEQIGVLLLAYRGYSGNDGAPNEQGLYSDARAALDWLEARGVAGSSTVLYGASLGSGVATQMAAERAYGAVVLEAPYTSIVDVAAMRFPIVPVGWLMKDRFDSLSRIASVTEPLLVMHGGSDTVVPQDLGRRLYDAARTPKEGFWPRGAGHDDIFDRGGFDVAVDFIERSVSFRG